jgi:hypothetical protein
VESIVLFALLAIAGSIFQSVILFRAVLQSTAQVRQDYLDVVLAQSKSFETALKHAHDTQYVGGTPLALAIAQHEAQRNIELEAARHNYELGKIDMEMRKQASAPRARPSVVPDRAAHGD